MLSNVTHSNFYFECNKERGSIDQLYIELGECIARIHNTVVTKRSLGGVYALLVEF